MDKALIQNIEALLEGYNGERVGFILGWFHKDGCSIASNLKDPLIDDGMDYMMETLRSGKETKIKR